MCAASCRRSARTQCRLYLVWPVGYGVLQHGLGLPGGVCSMNPAATYSHVGFAGGFHGATSGPLLDSSPTILREMLMGVTVLQDLVDVEHIASRSASLSRCEILEFCCWTICLCEHCPGWLLCRLSDGCNDDLVNVLPSGLQVLSWCSNCFHQMSLLTMSYTCSSSTLAWRAAASRFSWILSMSRNICLL